MMVRRNSETPFIILKWMSYILIVKVTLNVIAFYPGYFPPNFETDFLLGRQDYFWGAYSWSFYVHLISGPPTLIVGLLLLSQGFRKRWSKWHRMLGRFQIATVLLFLVPSGLWMAFYAMTGPVAGAGFVLLSVATGVAAFLGWRCAIRRKFQSHRKWMIRLYVLLCSAVVIRVVGGVATVMHNGAQWIYVMTAWGSWLVPLTILEIFFQLRNKEIPVTHQDQRTALLQE